MEAELEKLVEGIFVEGKKIALRTTSVQSRRNIGERVDFDIRIGEKIIKGAYIDIPGEDEQMLIRHKSPLCGQFDHYFFRNPSTGEYHYGSRLVFTNALEELKSDLIAYNKKPDNL